MSSALIFYAWIWATGAGWLQYGHYETQDECAFWANEAAVEWDCGNDTVGPPPWTPKRWSLPDD